MYYSYNCPACSKIFYVFDDSKEDASKKLFEGLKSHEHEYGEDQKDTTLTQYDEGTEENMIYGAVQESNEIPPGGYPLE